MNDKIQTIAAPVCIHLSHLAKNRNNHTIISKIYWIFVDTYNKYGIDVLKDVIKFSNSVLLMKYLTSVNVDCFDII
jgi:hypothetical protein